MKIFGCQLSSTDYFISSLSAKRFSENLDTIELMEEFVSVFIDDLTLNPVCI